MGVQVVWFKKDLRVTDHGPLLEAARRGPVLPLFVYEPEQLHHEEFAGHHLTYLNDGLRELDKRLRGLGTPLVIRTGEVVSMLECLHGELQRPGGIAGVWAHEETGNWVSFQRDRRVHAWARARGVPFTELPQNGVIRRLSHRDGWAATWEERMTAPLVATPEGLGGPAVAVPSEGLRGHIALGVPLNDKVIPVGGQGAAHETLQSFLQVRGVNYQRELSSPLTAEASCSRLSAPLAFGLLSVREVLQATRQRLAQVKGDPQADSRWVRSLRSYESRLHWHCHFMQRLESEPQMEFRNLNRALDGLRENDWDEGRFQAWAAGQTGYPLVDACMRMLHATGWLNFRMRAMLVSFASQHLWLHWRQTGLYLARQWLDNEPGIHWSQMQMQSSTVGINQVRIYSPTKQAREQDPTGAFIRRWIPELRDVPTDFIHAPWELPGGTPGYPAPIVDERAAVALAKSRIFAARHTDEFKAEAARIYEKHGSRKKAQLRQERLERVLPAETPRVRRGRTAAQGPVGTGAAAPALADQSVPAAQGQKKRQTRATRSEPMPDHPDLFGLTPEQPTPKAIKPARLPESWERALEAEFSAPYFQQLKDFLVQERRDFTIYPPAPDVMNALRLTPLDQVKVLILGQDPYHRPGQAHGLSFSVRPGVAIPPSLRNIYKELKEDLPGFTPPRHGHLRAWAEQGVLLLNAVLTVREGNANSHAGKGWEPFTDAVIRAVNAKEERVVFVLWGAYARKKAKLITGQQHIIIESAHPSPLSEAKFFGSRPFSQVNAALQEAGRGAIDWQLPMVAQE